MRHYPTLVAAIALLAATPAFAGNLTFDGGQTAWHTTQCTKPMPPTSVYSAQPDTQGDQMNSLISQHNAFVDAAQNYMNCISNEADRDQTMVNQAIASGAQREITAMQDEVNRTAASLRERQGH
jgi:hypothetical protein